VFQNLFSFLTVTLNNASDCRVTDYGLMDLVWITGSSLLATAW